MKLSPRVIAYLDEADNYDRLADALPPDHDLVTELRELAEESRRAAVHTYAKGSSR